MLILVFLDLIELSAMLSQARRVSPLRSGPDAAVHDTAATVPTIAAVAIAVAIVTTVAVGKLPTAAALAADRRIVPKAPMVVLVARG